MVGAGPATANPNSCSALSAAEPLAGTAPYAHAWIAIEQPGSWGRDALRSDALPHGIGPTLAERAKGARIGVLLIRHPHRPRHLSATDPRKVWVAHPGSNTLSCVDIDDCRDLLNWDLAALADGDLPSALAGTGPTDHLPAETTPLTLVCCHAARDACCAIHGRALYDALLAQASPEQADRLWQCSHLGGHRFAPTMLLLPMGIAYGRIDLLEAQSAIQAAARGEIMLDKCRGRTNLAAPVQVADLHLRALLPPVDASALTYIPQPCDLGQPLTDSTANTERVLARHRDGRAWELTVCVDRSGQCPAVL